MTAIVYALGPVEPTSSSAPPALFGLSAAAWRFALVLAAIVAVAAAAFRLVGHLMPNVDRQPSRMLVRAVGVATPPHVVMTSAAAVDVLHVVVAALW